MFKKLICILFNRHKPLLLQAIYRKPLITVTDRQGFDLVEIHMCENCNLVYWKPSE